MSAPAYNPIRKGKMKTYKYPARSEWKSLVKRPSLDVTQLFDVIRPIVDEVSARGDAALFDFEERFDQVRPERLLVSESEMASAAEQVDAALQDAIRQAYTQIERFHSAQRFSKMIGNKTVQTSSYSRQEGFTKQANPFAKNVNYQLQGVSVITSSQLLSLPMLKQVVLFQSYIDRPILADSPRWYLDPKMRALAKLPTAPNVPEWIVAQREDINDNMLEKLGLTDEEGAEGTA